MGQGSRPERVGEQIRQEIGQLLSRDVHDPRIGFVTVTRVKMSPDLQQARVYYTIIGDDRAKQETARGLDAARPFLRRHLGSRIRLRRVPELTFEFDRSVEHQDRVEQLLQEIADERKSRDAAAGEEPVPDATDGKNDS
jgi:ribosome-binding factor A